MQHFQPLLVYKVCLRHHHSSTEQHTSRYCHALRIANEVPLCILISTYSVTKDNSMDAWYPSLQDFVYPSAACLSIFSPLFQDQTQLFNVYAQPARSGPLQVAIVDCLPYRGLRSSVSGWQSSLVAVEREGECSDCFLTSLASSHIPESWPSARQTPAEKTRKLDGAVPVLPIAVFGSSSTHERLSVSNGGFFYVKVVILGEGQLSRVRRVHHITPPGFSFQ